MDSLLQTLFMASANMSATDRMCTLLHFLE